jgi:hypothetical protein
MAGVLLCASCAHAGDPVTWDLRAPTRPSELRPGRTSTVVSDSGAPSYTLLFPERSITGEFRQVTASTPVAAGPDGYIDTVTVDFHFTDRPEQVIANFATVGELFDVAGREREALDAYVDAFTAQVAVGGGRIDVDTLEPGTTGQRTSALGVVRDDHMTVVLLIGTLDVATISMKLVMHLGDATVDTE